MKQRKDLITGIHGMEEALNKGTEIQKVLIQKDTKNESIKHLVSMLREKKIFTQFVPKEKLNRLCNGVHQGIAALISPVEFINIEQLVPLLYETEKTPFLVVLDGITDVRNFGAICRSALFMGVHAVIIPARGSAEINEEAIKTSAGAILKINICRVNNLTTAIEYLKNSGLRIIAATEKAEQTISDVNLADPLAVILGAEDLGISGPVIKLAHEKVKIPSGAEFDSLNVSVAAGICFYEVFRQRNIEK